MARGIFLECCAHHPFFHAQLGIINEQEFDDYFITGYSLLSGAPPEGLRACIVEHSEVNEMR